MALSSHLWMERVPSESRWSRLRRNTLAGYALFSVKAFYISRVTAIVQSGRVTSNTRILLNLMLGNMSKSLTQSCQRHYYVNPMLNTLVLPLRALTQTCTRQKIKNQCFFLFGQCCCLRLSSERTAAPVDSFTLFFTNLLSICDKVIKFSHRGFCGGTGDGCNILLQENLCPEDVQALLPQNTLLQQTCRSVWVGCAVAAFTACTAKSFLKTPQNSPKILFVCVCVCVGADAGGSISSLCVQSSRRLWGSPPLQFSSHTRSRTNSTVHRPSGRTPSGGAQTTRLTDLRRRRHALTVHSPSRTLAALKVHT